MKRLSEALQEYGPEIMEHLDELSDRDVRWLAIRLKNARSIMAHCVVPEIMTGVIPPPPANLILAIDEECRGRMKELCYGSKTNLKNNSKSYK